MMESPTSLRPSVQLRHAFTQTPRPKMGKRPPKETFTAPKEVTSSVFERARALVRGRSREQASERARSSDFS